MKLMKNEWSGCFVVVAKSAKWMGRKTKLRRIAVWLLAMGLAGAAVAGAQGVSTTTVQGTVYLANGQPGAGTVAISWPAFTTAAGQAVAADSMTVTIATDGFVSVNLAPNLGATPAGEYYTAVYYMSDGSASTQYWVVPAAAQASLAQVQAQVMPAAQAVQTVSKAYVDQAITELSRDLADGERRDAERAAVFDRRSHAAFAGGGQTLCGCAGGDGGADCGREYDGTADGAGDQWRGGAEPGERTVDAAVGGERGGDDGSDGDSADIRGDRHVYESQRSDGDGFAAGRGATAGAEREGVWRSVRRGDGRHERAAGGDQLCQRARRGADDSRGDVQDADAELAWGVDWRIGQAGFGTDGISGAGCAGERAGRDEHAELHAAARFDDICGPERGRVVLAGGGAGGGGKLPDEPGDGTELDFFGRRQRAERDGGNGRGLVGGQLRDCDAGGDGRGR